MGKSKLESLTCAMCQLTLSDEKTMNLHLAGKKHRQQLQLVKNKDLNINGIPTQNSPPLSPLSSTSSSIADRKDFRCDICKITVPTLKIYESHINGNKHKKKVSKLMEDIQAGEKNKCIENNYTSNQLPQSTQPSNKWTLRAGHEHMTVQYIQTLDDLIKFENTVLSQLLSGPDGVFAVDCEGVPESLDLIQIAFDNTVVVIDCVILEKSDVQECLCPIFAANQITKVFHDLHKDVVALKNFGIFNIESLLDTQLAAEYLMNNTFVGLNRLFDHLSVPQHETKDTMKDAMRKYPDLWKKRPLDKSYVDYAALDAGLLLIAYSELLTNNKIDWEKLQLASMDRMRCAIEHNGKRAICFDKANNYRISSLELLERIRPQDAIKNEALKHECEVGELIDLLPEDLRSKLTQDGVTKYSLSDIVLDVGRRPWCWKENERIMLSDDTDRTITRDEIDLIVSQLGGFGTDNRAGLEKRLHRISGMRDRCGNIVGLTMRVGRWFQGNAAMLVDYLLGCDKSVLVLGEPGSGKTTIVREAVRVLSEQKNVCVVDTSNEIAGDGAIPHSCIGMARRMMVPSLDEQSKIMVECVQNHTPHVMVIDEIGRPREVEAARTVKQRGVRIIASAHGDLRSLVKNKELRGLVGGVESVTLGDAAAREEAQRKQSHGGAAGSRGINKTRTQRMGDPTFEVIVEVSRGKFHEWRIVKDTASAVDSILDGRKYHAEVRKRDPHKREVFLELIDA